VIIKSIATNKEIRKLLSFRVQVQVQVLVLVHHLLQVYLVLQ
jgi:hypothetical protein